MVTNATVADLWQPYEKGLARFYDLTLIVGGSMLIAACAKVKILLPLGPVPVTGQTFAVLMIGALLGPRRGCLAVLAYLIEGAAGLPVFAFGGGLLEFAGPTGGYLLGFLPAACITGFLARRGWDRRMSTTVLAMTIGNAVIYACGLFRLCCLMGVTTGVLTVGLFPFVAGDMLKIALAAILLPSGWKLLKYFSLAGNDEP
jgi:biotin transport system substrate-specific component